MDKQEQIINKRVNLSAYSKSKFFIGYFEWSFSKEHNDKLVRDCVNLLRSISINYTIMTKLEIFDALSDADKVICRKKFFDILGNEYKFISSDINLNNHEDIDRVKKIIDGIFQGNLFGHVFFLDKNSEVIIYPHDDLGLGFIAPDGYLEVINDAIAVNLDEKYSVSLAP